MSSTQNILSLFQGGLETQLTRLLVEGYCSMGSVLALPNSYHLGEYQLYFHALIANPSATIGISSDRVGTCHAECVNPGAL